MPRNAKAFEHAGPFVFDAPAGAYHFRSHAKPDRSDAGTQTAADADGIIHGCPCGCGAWSGLWFKGRGAGGPEWDVTGEWPNVTLSPSIGIHGSTRTHQPGSPYHWHGYLRAGVFEEC